MYYITYNEVITPGMYESRADAIIALTNIFVNLDFKQHDIAYWPDEFEENKIKIQIKKRELE